MKKAFALFLALCLLVPLFAFAEESAGNAPAASGDNLVVTSHTALIDGKEIPYTATVGTMALSSELGQYEIFFTALTMDGVEDLGKRPVTFVFNGGPGSSSCWLQLGLLGPTAIDINDEGLVDRLNIATRNNEYSILDLTDLVFIDPVGTGYSAALPGTDPAVFYDYYNDIDSIGFFIRQYLNRYNRWLSPKYLAGESYGTMRAVGLCDYLQSELRLSMDGLILISCYNDFINDEYTGGNDIPYVNFFPSMAASAWYHKKADSAYLDMTIEAYMDEARAFASGEYLAALYQAGRLTAAEKDAVAERMSGFLGVSKEYILESNLRVDYLSFCDELLKDRNLRIGRADTRVTGPVTNGSIANGSGDPSGLGIFEVFNTAYCDYVANTLGFKTERIYQPLSLGINASWTNRNQSQEETIYDIMTKNRFLRIWVISGYYDFATPFYGTEWVFSHANLSEETQKNLTFTYNKSGHLFYLYMPSRIQFRKDAVAWFGAQK